MQHSLRSFLRKYAWALVIICVAIGFKFFADAPLAESQSGSTDLTGYAWSDTVGWISMNCATGNPSGGSICGTSNYKVTINADRTLTGYAWSDSIGWIRFGGLGTPPSGTNSDARIDTAANTLRGWARALSNDVGWDGWISFNCADTSCATSNYGVGTGYGTFDSGYAWGSDVVGWVNMQDVKWTMLCTPSVSCSADDSGVVSTDQWCADTTTACTAGRICSDTTLTCVAATPTGSFTISPQRTRAGRTVSVSWTSANASTCSVSGTNGDSWTGTSGTQTSAAITSPVTYTLTCTDIDGLTMTVVDTEIVSLIPTLQEI